jgi:hypothetical protein
VRLLSGKKFIDQRERTILAVQEAGYFNFDPAHRLLLLWHGRKAWRECSSKINWTTAATSVILAFTGRKMFYFI